MSTKREVLIDFRKVTEQGTIWEGGTVKILATRENLGRAKIKTSSIVPTEPSICRILWGYTGTLMWHTAHAELEVDESQFRETDVIVARTEKYTQDRHPECKEPIVYHSLLAGKTQNWFNFHERWRDWVRNPVVRDSAMKHINRFAIGLDIALQIFQLSEKFINLHPTERDFQKWLFIAKIILGDPQVEWLLHKTTCRGRTCIAVDAMLLRIASCVGWIPPKGFRRPRYTTATPQLFEIQVEQ